MKSSEIRQKFLDFFASKQHKIVPSAPIVNKDDPTLLFTNAGMNQFKDFFLGNQEAPFKRTADTQKCLRVSGKQNDLEEVGRDSYHQTMFEMLGNWSFGDYFKEEAIEWAWEFLTEELKIPKDRLYASYFEGDKEDNLEPDNEALNFWKKWLPEDRILPFDKKDNFWEMGDTGPCGPCSEIHVDMRSDEARKKVDGATLVNADDPKVIEIWNLVFIQFNRKADNSLEQLPAKHVDTGMGFERLTMVMQNKTSNYTTDIFSDLMKKIETDSGVSYKDSYAPDAMSDIAIRVIADHIRGIAFCIADGQLPGNTGAGYVVRRILRRAVRYYFSFLNIKTPYLHQLIPMLADQFENIFPELKAQADFVAKVIQEEEKSFLRTLDAGLKRFEALEIKNNQIEGKAAFELYDTYGFPIDLTRLIAEEKGYAIDEVGFEKALNEQKNKGKADAKKSTGDWQILNDSTEVEFVGYDQLEISDIKILKHRTVEQKGKTHTQVVLNKTPFYAESGGQRGDSGWLQIGNEKVAVFNTVRENELIIHQVKSLPADLSGSVSASVNTGKRKATEKNHTAVHLMHAALHKILGEHALQKGQDVDGERLRFDFSHFQRMTEEEVANVELMVNQKIRENIQLEENRNMPIEAAKASGATMLFGEKYGDTVRVITFGKDFSMELCGGTHVPSTGHIGLFKILSESSVAAGVRRIEAVTGEKAEAYINGEIQTLNDIRGLFKNPKDIAKNVAALQEENKKLQKQLEEMLHQQAGALKDQLKAKVENINGINFLGAKLPLSDAKAIKTLAYDLKKELENLVIVFGAEVKGKPQLTIVIDEGLVESRQLHAGNMIRELAKAIQGGGGGQPFFATAGGSNAAGLETAIQNAKAMLS